MNEKGEIRGRRTVFFMLLPITVFLLVFFLYPVLYELYVSFFDFSLGSEMEFIGFGNYGKMGRDDQFLGSLVTTLIFITTAVAAELVLGFFIANLLNRQTRMVNAVRTMILIPTIFTPLVAGLVWKALYHPDMGAITYYLRQIGIDIGRGLTVERNTALLSIVIVDIWQWTPLMVLIILAGLKSLPLEPYEAGIVDGAGKWHLFRYITLPLMRPTLVVALLIRTLDAMKIFDTIWAITGGGPGTATTVANLRIYEVGVQQLQIGYASSLSNVLLIIGIIVGILFVNTLYSSRRGGVR